MKDLVAGPVTLETVSSAGIPPSGTNGDFLALSADGRFLAFTTNATNLDPSDADIDYDVYVRDRLTGQTDLVSGPTPGAPPSPIRGVWDVSISAGGRFVAFTSFAADLVLIDTNASNDVFVRDRWTGSTVRVSVAAFGLEGNLASATCSISEHGRFVTFASAATNLVPGDRNGFADIFVHDRDVDGT